MRSTKNTDRGRATTCSIKAWEGSVWRLSGDLSTQQFSTLATCTYGMIQGFGLPQYANYSLTQHLSDLVIQYIDSTIQQDEYDETEIQDSD